MGVLPTLKLWAEFFQSKLGTVVAGVPAPCGAFIAMRRASENNSFPSIPLIQSVKLWQKSYFYVRNVAQQGDYVNLPAYKPARRLGGDLRGATGPGRYLRPGTQPSPGFG